MFIYFDLGNVLAFFDHQQGCRQMAEVAGVSPERVWSALFDSDLSRRYELGQITSRQFYDEFCELIEARPDFDALYLAAGEIFQLNYSMIPVVAELESAGYRLGLLSNTSECHWAHFLRAGYCEIPRAFSALALSFEIGALKPDPAIYAAAAELAGVPAREILFCDDIPGHVAAAREAGFDAVQYTTTPALAADLHQRGVRFNY